MIICTYSSKLSSMGICSYIHFIKALKSKQNWMILLMYPFFVAEWRLKVTKHLIYSIYCLAAVPARSQVVLPSKRGMLAQKLVTLASTILEYYIGNRGDERKWNKRTESSRSTNVKSSLLGCLVVRGSVSAEHGGFRCFQHWIPWIHFIIVCLRINYACKMFLLKIILQCSGRLRKLEI